MRGRDMPRTLLADGYEVGPMDESQSREAAGEEDKKNKPANRDEGVEPDLISVACAPDLVSVGLRTTPADCCETIASTAPRHKRAA